MTTCEPTASDALDVVRDLHDFMHAHNIRRLRVDEVEIERDLPVHNDIILRESSEVVRLRKALRSACEQRDQAYAQVVEREARIGDLERALKVKPVVLYGGESRPTDPEVDESAQAVRQACAGGDAAPLGLIHGHPVCRQSQDGEHLWIVESPSAEKVEQWEAGVREGIEPGDAYELGLPYWYECANEGCGAWAEPQGGR